MVIKYFYSMCLIQQKPHHFPLNFLLIVSIEITKITHSHFVKFLISFVCSKFFNKIINCVLIKLVLNQ